MIKRQLFVLSKLNVTKFQELRIIYIKQLTLKLLQNIRSSKEQISQNWTIRVSIIPLSFNIFPLSFNLGYKHPLFDLITELSNKKCKDFPNVRQLLAQVYKINSYNFKDILTIYYNHSKELYLLYQYHRKKAFCKNFEYTVKYLASIHTYGTTKYMKSTLRHLFFSGTVTYLTNGTVRYGTQE